MISINSGEAQKCFSTADGFRLCNFVVRNGKEIRSNTGKYIKFKILSWVKKQKTSKDESIDASVNDIVSDIK